MCVHHFTVVILIGLVSASWLGGCQNSTKGATVAPPVHARMQLSEGYSLLHMVLKKNSQVDKVFILKSGTEPFKDLLRDVATMSKAGVDAIELIAETDTGITLETANLPEAEAATREVIEKSVRSKVLKSNKKPLQKILTLSQIEATSYVSHLAITVAAMEDDPDRQDILKGIAEGFTVLHDRLVETIDVE